MRNNCNKGAVGFLERDAEDQAGADLRGQSEVHHVNLAAKRCLHPPASRRSSSWNTRSAARRNSSSDGNEYGRSAARRSNASKTSRRSVSGSASKLLRRCCAASPIRCPFYAGFVCAITSNHLNVEKATTIYLYMQTSTGIWRHMPLYSVQRQARRRAAGDQGISDSRGAEQVRRYLLQLLSAAPDSFAPVGAWCVRYN